VDLCPWLNQTEISQFISDGIRLAKIIENVTIIRKFAARTNRCALFLNFVMFIVDIGFVCFSPLSTNQVSLSLSLSLSLSHNSFNIICEPGCW